jgi:hypothetical protein
MNPILDNWEEVYREVADAIERDNTFRENHSPAGAGVHRHPAANAYAYVALLAAASTISSKPSVPDTIIKIQGNLTEADVTKIVEGINRYRRMHGDSPG